MIKKDKLPVAKGNDQLHVAKESDKSPVIVEKRVKKIVPKSLSRFFAVQVLFAYYSNESENIDELLEFIEEHYISDELKDYKEQLNYEYLKMLLEETIKNISQIDQVITEAIKPKFSIEKLDALSKTIFRLAVYEMKWTDLDKKIVISEYVDIAGEYVGNKEISFINAILDKIKNII